MAKGGQTTVTQGKWNNLFGFQCNNVQEKNTQQKTLNVKCDNRHQQK